MRPSGFVQRSDGSILPLDEDLPSLQGGGGVRQAHGVLRQRRPLAGHWGAGGACIRPGGVGLQDAHHLLPPGERSIKWLLYSSQRKHKVHVSALTCWSKH